MKQYIYLIITLTMINLLGEEKFPNKLQLINPLDMSKYICKWEFVRISDFKYDPFSDPEQYPLSYSNGGISFNPTAVQDGDIIFLRAREVHTFFKEIEPQIAASYIIVAHGEYLDGFKEEYIKYLDQPNLLAWFGTHPCHKDHHKFFQIPLGVFANPWVLKNLDTTFLNDKWQDLFIQLRGSQKKGLVYGNFAEWTSPERGKIKQLFFDKPYCYFNSRIGFEDYLKEMAQYYFTFAPRGLGIDSYRLWEALLVGTIPIIKSSYLDHQFSDLPVLIVNEWEDINEEFLRNKYEEISARKWKLDKLYMNYWINEINKQKNKIVKK